MILETGKTVGEIVIEHPGSVRVFESLGIDYCCGGKSSLDDACRRVHVPLDEALRLLALADAEPAKPEPDWRRASIAALTTHIVEQHHGYVRRESTRLAAMAAQVVARHGAAHHELAEIRDVLGAMVEELFTHMAKEEAVLFSYFVKMEAAFLEGGPPPPAAFGSVEAPIARMLADHDDCGELAARIRELSGDFRPPDDACPTYHALFSGLEEFERDLHRHVHLENNILFPRALQMEREGGAHAAS